MWPVRIMCPKKRNQTNCKDLIGDWVVWEFGTSRLLPLPPTSVCIPRRSPEKYSPPFQLTCFVQVASPKWDRSRRGCSELDLSSFHPFPKQQENRCFRHISMEGSTKKSLKSASFLAGRLQKKKLILSWQINWQIVCLPPKLWPDPPLFISWGRLCVLASSLHHFKTLHFLPQLIDGFLFDVRHKSNQEGGKEEGG